MRAIANEIAKNLVLSGIGALTLQDDQVVGEDDLGAQFLVSDADVGKKVSSNQKSLPSLSHYCLSEQKPQPLRFAN